MLTKAAFFFLYLIQLLPHCAIRLLARVTGFITYRAVMPRRRIGRINLRLCFPDLSPRQREAILKEHFYHMALLLLEYGLYWYGKPERLKNMVHYRDKHFLDNTLAAGEKVIILYPHFTAFEAALYAFNQDNTLISIYAHQKNKIIDEQILKGRHRYRNVFLISRNEGLRAIIKKIRGGTAPFVYLPDQDFGPKESVFAGFFGVPTATTPAMGRIAGMTGAKIIPAIPTRGPDGTVTLRFYPPWEAYPGGDVLADTQRMNDFIEARARENPAQYYWLHKRFKTRPEGEPSFYSPNSKQPDQNPE